MAIPIGFFAGKGKTRPYFIGMGARTTWAGGSGTLNIPFPSGLETGDLILIVAQEDQIDNNTYNGNRLGPGWTTQRLVGNESTLEFAWKIYDPSMGGQLAISLNKDHQICRAYAFRNAYQYRPIHKSSSKKSATTSQTFVTEKVTTEVPNCLVLALVGHDIASEAQCVSDWSPTQPLGEAAELDDISTTLGWNGGYGVFSGYADAAADAGAVSGALTIAKYINMFTIAIAPKKELSAPSVVHTADAFFNAQSTVFSGDRAVGSAEETRRIVAAIEWWGPFTGYRNRQLLSAYIGLHNPARIIAQSLSPDGGMGIAWFTAIPNSDAAATDSIYGTFDGNFLRAHLSVWKLTNLRDVLETAVYDFDGSSSPLSGTIAVPEGGVLLSTSLAEVSSFGSPAATWTGVSKDHEMGDLAGGVANLVFSNGHASGLSANPARALSVAIPNLTSGKMSALVWR